MQPSLRIINSFLTYFLVIFNCFSLTMAPKWSDDTNIKFVELYKEKRCLWDQHHDLYKNKNARETALSEIVGEMNIEGFGVAEAKAKIKSLRGTFNIEFAKQQKSAKSGCGSADVYVPTLKWFNIMKQVMVKGTLKRQTTSTLVSKILFFFILVFLSYLWFFSTYHDCKKVDFYSTT